MQIIKGINLFRELLLNLKSNYQYLFTTYYTISCMNWFVIKSLSLSHSVTHSLTPSPTPSLSHSLPRFFTLPLSHALALSFSLSVL